jgi:hypothetical protein
MRRKRNDKASLEPNKVAEASCKRKMRRSSNENLPSWRGLSTGKTASAKTETSREPRETTIEKRGRWKRSLRAEARSRRKARAKLRIGKRNGPTRFDGW